MQKHFLRFTCLAFIALGCGCTSDSPSNTPAPSFTPETSEQIDLAHHFESVEGPGTFLLYDASSKHQRIYNAERAQQRFLPASTFKIPNSLFALELGVATDSAFAITRDTVLAPAQEWWPAMWNQRRHTLHTAFQNSVFWYYQEIARRIGERRMQGFVDYIGYGNQNIGGGIDQFWLNGDLRISPEEQLAFLVRMYNNELGFSERSTAIVKDIMVMEETEAYRLSGKTGTGELTQTRELGWLIGFVEIGQATHFYVLNMEGERVWEEWPPQKRIDLVKAILREQNVLPPLAETTS